MFQSMIRYPDVTVEEGRVTFVTGPSGVGKSTLLHLLNGTLSPSEGQVFYRGQDIASLDSLALRREVLLARQAAFLFDSSIRQNFREFYQYREEPELSDSQIREWLLLCLADFPLDQSCATLSGGEKQRVFLALGLSLRPRVLLLDEPTSALDADTGNALMGRILGHCRERGVTPVVVSHDQRLTERHAQDRIRLERGA